MQETISRERGNIEELIDNLWKDTGDFTDLERYAYEGMIMHEIRLISAEKWAYYRFKHQEEIENKMESE